MRISNIPRLTVKHSAKLRSAPARGTASGVYLRMHQLANEQDRLERELQTLSDRTKEVVIRIAELQTELSGLNVEATRKLNQSEVKAVTITPRSLYQIQSASGKKFTGMTIDY